MGGLRRLCKLYGGIEFNGTKYLWDYVRDEPRKESEMTPEEIKASEKAKWAEVKKNLDKLKNDGQKNKR